MGGAVRFKADLSDEVCEEFVEDALCGVKGLDNVPVGEEELLYCEDGQSSESLGKGGTHIHSPSPKFCWPRFLPTLALGSIFGKLEGVGLEKKGKLEA